MPPSRCRTTASARLPAAQRLGHLHQDRARRGRHRPGQHAPAAGPSRRLSATPDRDRRDRPAGKVTCNPALPNRVRDVRHRRRSTQRRLPWRRSTCPPGPHTSRSPTPSPTCRRPRLRPFNSVHAGRWGQQPDAQPVGRDRCRRDGQARLDVAAGRRPVRHLGAQLRRGQPYRDGRSHGQRDRGHQRDPDREQQLTQRARGFRGPRTGSRESRAPAGRVPPTGRTGVILGRVSVCLQPI